MERRFLSQHKPHTVIRDGSDGATIVGTAAVFYDGTRDTEFELWPGVFERIMPGTFDRSVKDKANVVALFNHDPALLLGRTASGTLKLSINDDGLRYEVEPGDTTVARDVVEHIKRGDLEGSSFGFRVMGEDWRTEDGQEIREITDVELFDVSPVTYPAYTSTSTGLRAAGEAMAEARTSYEAWKAGCTPEVRKRLLAAKQAVPGLAACG